MNSKVSVLIIDDEAKIRELIKSYLEINGYSAICAAAGLEGLNAFEKYKPSLILLDLMLPDITGEECCRRIREVSAVPIIMLTAKVDEESIIRGLKTGADDYVCKPFSPRQLVARVEAALRRTARTGSSGAPLAWGDLVVDQAKRQALFKGTEIALTRDEYFILTLLMSRPAKIFTREEILQNVKGDEYEGFDRAVDTHIKNLRAKLGDDPRSPKYIITVYGMGYRFGAGEAG
ncbi:response regulator transcription factor [Leadbettera azotonutricia]|nr:response regulator transcription factor [Leadbettera azotonutricia]